MASENSIITLARRENLTKITSGAITALPKITYIAFGNGGTDAEGNPIPPILTDTTLKSEICRYPVETPTYPVTTTARYTVSIPKTEQAGVKFNEMALVDEAGTLCAIKTMYTKQKDDDVIFTFTFDDEF